MFPFEPTPPVTWTEFGRLSPSRLTPAYPCGKTGSPVAAFACSSTRRCTPLAVPVETIVRRDQAWPFACSGLPAEMRIV